MLLLDLDIVLSLCHLDFTTLTSFVTEWLAFEQRAVSLN